MSDQNSNIDISEVLRLAQNISKTQEQFSPPTLSLIDKATTNQQMRILKASLPYFDLRQQRNIAMMVKLMEFQRTVQFFKEPIPEESPLYTKKAVNKMDFLNDIKNSCDEPQQKKLNLMITLMNMQATMEQYKNNPKLMNPSYEEKSEVKSEAKAADQESEYNQFMNMVNKIIDEKR